MPGVSRETTNQAITTADTAAESESSKSNAIGQTEPAG